MLAVSLAAFLECTTAVLALLVYVGAGLGYALTVVMTPHSAPEALDDYLDTHTVPSRIEAALQRGEIVSGLTTRQVSLLNGAPRAVTQCGDRLVWVYDGTALDAPSWTYVGFENGRVVTVEHVRTQDAVRRGGVEAAPSAVAPE